MLPLYPRSQCVTELHKVKIIQRDSVLEQITLNIVGWLSSVLGIKINYRDCFHFLLSTFKGFVLMQKSITAHCAHYSSKKPKGFQCILQNTLVRFSHVERINYHSNLHMELNKKHLFKFEF